MPVLIALMHDILIVAGVYALVGREVTTATVAALLTILGYSLYDTIIVFDRVRENIPRMPSAAFSQIVNRSLCEVLTRSLATSFCTLLPVLSLLLFGGETLQDFAFALLSASPRVPTRRSSSRRRCSRTGRSASRSTPRRAARISETLGEVPAYATTAQGGPVDVDPSDRGRRRARITAPQDPAAGVSRGRVRRHGRQPRASRTAGEARAGRRRPRRGARRQAGAGARMRSRRRRTAAAGARPGGGSGADPSTGGDGREAQEAAQPQAREAPLMACSCGS